MLFLLSHAAYYVPEDRKVKTVSGLFTQKQLIYKAIALLEGQATDAEEPQKCILLNFPELFLRLPEGKQSLTYARLREALQNNERVAIYDAKGDVSYAIWPLEPNVMPTVAPSEGVPVQPSLM